MGWGWWGGGGGQGALAILTDLCIKAVGRQEASRHGDNSTAAVVELSVREVPLPYCLQPFRVSSVQVRGVNILCEGYFLAVQHLKLSKSNGRRSVSLLHGASVQRPRRARAGVPTRRLSAPVAGAPAAPTCASPHARPAPLALGACPCPCLESGPHPHPHSRPPMPPPPLRRTCLPVLPLPFPLRMAFSLSIPCPASTVPTPGTPSPGALMASSAFGFRS